jgi:hypothetical protein
VLLSIGNLETRRVAVGFTKFDEIKTVIGQTLEIEFNDEKASIKSGSMEISMDISSGITTLKNGANEVKCDSTGWTFDGKVTFNAEVTIKKKLTADDEITAAKKISSDEDVVTGAISLKNHKHGYTDDGAPLTTQPPQ